MALARVSANTFDVLGTTMAVGRPFTVEEDVEDADGVAVPTYGFWQLELALVLRRRALRSGRIRVLGAQGTSGTGR